MRPVRAAAPAVLNGTLAGGVVGCDAQAAAIEEQFRRQLAGLRRRCRPWEIAGVMRGLQEDRRVALRLLRERQAAARQSERQVLPRAPPPKP